MTVIRGVVIQLTLRIIRPESFPVPMEDLRTEPQFIVL